MNIWAMREFLTETKEMDIFSQLKCVLRNVLFCVFLEKVQIILLFSLKLSIFCCLSMPHPYKQVYFVFRLIKKSPHPKNYFQIAFSSAFLSYRIQKINPFSTQLLIFPYFLNHMLLVISVDICLNLFKIRSIINLASTNVFSCLF